MMTVPNQSFAGPATIEGGQAAFAAIQEIVLLLLADPKTDWHRVDVPALRQHLVDMDNVTMRADIQPEMVDGGARFLVAALEGNVAASIKRTAFAHAATMNGTEGWQFTVREVETGVTFTATDVALRIRALGFVGRIAVGAHHQRHHLTLARGEMPH